MKKINFLFKNVCYFSVFIIFILLFLCLRIWQLFFLTNLDSGMCYEFKMFDLIYIICFITFYLISLIFFRFIKKPELSSFDFVKNNYFLGIHIILFSVIFFAISFIILFDVKNKFSVSPIFNLLFFLTGLFVAISLFYLSLNIFNNKKSYKNAFSLVFFSLFFWFTVRLMNLFLDNLFLKFAKTEYCLMVVGLITMYMFIFNLGQINLNIYEVTNKIKTKSNFMIYGFCGVFIVFSNVLSKLILTIYVMFKNINITSNYFQQNLNILNVHNFCLADFLITILIFYLLIFSFYSNKKSINKNINLNVKEVN